MCLFCGWAKKERKMQARTKWNANFKDAARCVCSPPNRKWKRNSTTSNKNGIQLLQLVKREARKMLSERMPCRKCCCTFETFRSVSIAKILRQLGRWFFSHSFSFRFARLVCKAKWNIVQMFILGCEIFRKSDARLPVRPNTHMPCFLHFCTIRICSSSFHCVSSKILHEESGRTHAVPNSKKMRLKTNFSQNMKE